MLWIIFWQDLFSDFSGFMYLFRLFGLGGLVYKTLKLWF